MTEGRNMESNTKENWLKKVQLSKDILLVVSFVIIPLVFFPPLGTMLVKQLAFTVILCVYLVLLAFEILLSGHLTFTKSRYTLPLFLLAVLSTLSVVLKTKNYSEAFFSPGGVSLYLLAFVFFLLAGYRIKHLQSQLLVTLSGSAVVLAILSSVYELGLWQKLTFLPKSVRLFDFGYLGGSFNLVTLFVPIVIMLAISANQTKVVYRQILHYIAIFIITAGVFVNIYTLLPGKKNALTTTPLSTSWNVAIDSFRNSPLIGIGTSNYLSAINRYRPLSYNTTKYWSLRFQSATNYPLTLVTEMGILGLVTLAYLLILAAKDLLGKGKDFSVLDGLAGTILVGLLLTNLTTTIIFLLVLGLSVRAGKSEIKLTDGSPVPLFVTAIPLLAIAFLVVTATYKNTKAEYLFNQALVSGNSGNGVVAYDKVNGAIGATPKVDRYHIYASQINLSLASAIIKNNGDKKLADADRETVTKLIEQAINEAKTAVSLNPQKSTNWSNLATIYQAVAPFAQGAIDFAIQSTNQAIALDPLDPQLRLTLGGMYFGAKAYDDAIDAFKTAVLAKPDWANAHYNLAVAYREAGNLPKAIIEMKNVLALVDKSSKDYETAQTELTALEDKLPKPSPNPEAETLTKPETVTKEVNPPVTLPEDAQPPLPTEAPAPEATPAL